MELTLKTHFYKILHRSYELLCDVIKRWDILQPSQQVLSNELSPHDLFAEQIGEHLKQQRLLHQHTLDELEYALKIRKRFLEYIENGQFNHLPDTNSAIGFIKTYADFYQLPTQALVVSLKGHLNTSEQKTEKNSFLNKKPGPVIYTKPSRTLATLSCIIMFIFYSLWSEWHHKNSVMITPNDIEYLQYSPLIPQISEEFFPHDINISF